VNGDFWLLNPSFSCTYSSNFQVSYIPKFSNLLSVFGFEVGILLEWFYVVSRNRSPAAAVEELLRVRLQV
jgi:hypothetical protein